MSWKVFNVDHSHNVCDRLLLMFDLLRRFQLLLVKLCQPRHIFNKLHYLFHPGNLPTQCLRWLQCVLVVLVVLMTSQHCVLEVPVDLCHHLLQLVLYDQESLAIHEAQ